MRNSPLKLLLAGIIVIIVLVYGFQSLSPEKSVKDRNTSSSNSVGDNSKGDASDGLLLYCAAGIKPPVSKIAEEFQTEIGAAPQIQYGGSGTLLSNLKVAQKGDLYLAADDSYLLQARKEGLVREILPLAKMKPVLAFAKGNPKNIQGLKDLLREDLNIACATPDAAAVGKLTRQLLTEAGIWDELEPNVKVFEPTVNGIANALKLGSVDVGIIWDAVANQYEEIETLVVPEFESGTQHVSIGVLESSERPTQALKFARYLAARDRGGKVFESMGYPSVNGDVWAEVPKVTFFSGGVNRMAIQDTLKSFEEREGVSIATVYNGCGILVAQMKAGEKPDAYFACDVSFMDSVADMFMDSMDLSKTDIVIIVPKGNPKSIHTLENLARPGLKLGLAHYEQSALGALTQRLLVKANLQDSVNANVRVQTPTADLLVNQMIAGSLDAAVVYTANTSQVRDKIELVHIDHPAANAIQPYAVSKSSEQPYLMNRLLENLRAAESKDQFKKVGFEWLAGE